MEITDLSVKLDALPLDLTVHPWMHPPVGAPVRRFTFNYDDIVHQVVSHKAFVFVRNDWNALQFHPVGQMPPVTRAIGLIRYLVYAVPIDRTPWDWSKGFR